MKDMKQEGRGKKITAFLLALLMLVSAAFCTDVPVSAASIRNDRITAKIERSSTSTIKLSWNKSSMADGYIILRRASVKHKYKKIKTVGKNITSYTDKGLSAGKAYQYAVRAYRKEGKKNIYSVYLSLIHIYGTAEVPAPQAGLMKMIVEGIMGGNLPWTLVFVGVCLAIGLEILRIPVMPFAIGLYLPIYLNATIMIGGVVRMFMDGRKKVDQKTKESQVTNGTLYCAGMIAGEGLVGIFLAILAVAGVTIPSFFSLGNIGGVVVMALMILCLLKFSLWNKRKA